MRKYVSFLLALLILAQVTLVMPVLAEEVQTTDEVEVYVTIEEDLAMSAQGSAVLRAATCCDGRMNLKWGIRVRHVFSSPYGKCKLLRYFRVQYCTNCGTIWKQILAKETPGCGKYHGVISV